MTDLINAKDKYRNMETSGAYELKKASFQVVRDAIDRMAACMRIDPKYSALAVTEAGATLSGNAPPSYDPTAKKLRLNRSYVGEYVSVQKNLKEVETGQARVKDEETRLKAGDASKYEIERKGIEFEKKHFDRVVKYFKERVAETRGRLDRDAYHEGYHRLRYLHHPETEQEERINPTRRKVEEALSEFATAVFTGMEKNKILEYIASLEEDPHLGQARVYGTMRQLLAEVEGENLRLKERLGDKAEEKDSIRIAKKTAETIVATADGYRLGFLAALGVESQPEEKKFEQAEQFLKNNDPKQILAQLEKLGEKGLYIYEKSIQEE